MSSFSETKALSLFEDEVRGGWGVEAFSNLAQETSRKFLAYNRRNLSRIYPKGSRIDSSNMSMNKLFLS